MGKRRERQREEQRREREEVKREVEKKDEQHTDERTTGQIHTQKRQGFEPLWSRQIKEENREKEK